MKYILTIAMVLALPVMAAARYTGPLSNQTAVSVAEAKKLFDDTYVVLEGRIENRIRGDNYLFSDGTGTIVVEIEDDEWRGATVSENDRVRIYGEVDTSLFHETEIEVKSIDILR